MSLDLIPAVLRPRVVADLDNTHDGVPCWHFTGRWTSGNGYSKVRWDGTAWVVHRLLFWLIRGPVCRVVQLDHRCRRRWCVNPAHLEPELPVRNTHLGAAILFKRGGGHGRR